MTKIIVDFSIRYNEQPQEVKEILCKHDFYEVKALLLWKRTFKDAIVDSMKER